MDQQEHFPHPARERKEGNSDLTDDHSMYV
jgi:hypothetical protein